MPDLAMASVALREWRSDDIELLVRACNDPEIIQRLGVPSPYADSDALQYVDACAEGWRNASQFTFAVSDRSSLDALGSVRVGPSPGGATAGYWIAPWARRRGHAALALSLVVPWARAEGLEPIRLYIAPDNVASQGVARAAGFRRDRDEIVDPEGVPGDLVFVIR